MRLITTTLLLAALAGCAGSGTAPADAAVGTSAVVGTLAVTSARPDLVVSNRGGALVRLHLLDADVQPLALFAPCDSTCVGVPAGQTVRIPMTAIVGFSARSREVYITSWQFAPGPNDRVDSSIQTLRVRLD